MQPKNMVWPQTFLFNFLFVYFFEVVLSLTKTKTEADCCINYFTRIDLYVCIIAVVSG